MITAAKIRERLLRPWKHGDHVDFRGVICKDRLDISGVAVDGVDFTGARFLGGIDASCTHFAGLAWFRDVVIEGPANFSGAVFMIDARFEGVKFQQAAGFCDAEFRGIGRFDGAVFAADADFSGTTCYGNFSLQSAESRGSATFRGSEWLGGLWCEDARFPAGVDLSDTQVHGRLWLRQARRGNAALRSDDFGMSFGYTYI